MADPKDKSKEKEAPALNPRAVFSKTGKGVQEASGRTSHLSRADRNVLKEIDGKTSVQDVGAKFEKIAPDKLEKLIQQLDRDGFIREISHGEEAPSGRPSVLPKSVTAPPRAAPPPSGGGGDDMDFTAFAPRPAAAAPKGPAVDLAAAARADQDRAAKEKEATDFRARQEAEARAKAEAAARAKAEAAARARAEAEARARAEAEARAKAEATAKAHAEAASKAQAEADAKVRAAREAAVRMATEAKARIEAEAKARADELNAKLEQERKAREEAERRAQEAAEVARRELEEKAKRDAEELRQRLEAEMKAKLEEERRKREEEDRKRREEDERRRKAEDERRAKEDAERRAREEADRQRRKEEDERRAKEEAERRAREEADRKRREEEDRKRREEEERRRKAEDERRAKEDAERRAREESDRKRRDEEERKQRDEEDRRRREEAEARARAEATAPPPAPAAPPPPAPPAAPASAAGGSFGDSLLADLDSFGKREEEERREKEEAERKAKEEAARKAKAEAERKAKEEAEKKRREEEERRRKEEEERKAQEEAEERARAEEEQRTQEEAERKRKAKEALAARQAKDKAEEAGAAGAAAPEKKGAKPAAAAADDDIGVTEDDLDMDDVKRDEKKISAEARKAARERERERAPAPAYVPGQAAKKPISWGKPVAIGLFVVLVGGLGFLQVMPLSSADYQKAASDALGLPVTIGSARLSVLTGVEVKFEGVTVGEVAKINVVRGYPGIGSVFGAKKSFSRLDLEGVVLQQGDLAGAVLGKIGGENFQVERITAKGMKFDNQLGLPGMDVDAKIAGDGAVQSITLNGPDKLNVQLTPNGNDIAFEIGAASLVVPFVPALTLSDFGMKGTANRQGVTASQFDGRSFDGLIGGTAKIRWGSGWTVEGDLRMRGVRVAVFAPTLVSEGKVEGKGTYSMSGAAPAKLFEGARMEGNIKIENGVLGSFDLTRALQTGGAQTGGRTVFSELSAQGVYDKGTTQLRNIQVTAGNMNGSASLDIDPAGALSGRIVADVKTPSQQLRATLNISGKIQEPVIRK